MRIPTTITLFIALILSACSSTSPPKTEVTVFDYRNTDGAYVLVYSVDEAFRVSLEDRLVADLADRELRAVPSHPDIPDIRASSRDEVLAFAKDEKVMFVLVVEEVLDGETGVVNQPSQVTYSHPTLQDFYQDSLPEDYDPDGDGQVFVEVSAFLIQEDSAKLVWSGTTWSVQADGEGDRVGDISATIADAIKQAQRRRRMGFE